MYFCAVWIGFKMSIIKTIEWFAKIIFLIKLVNVKLLNTSVHRHNYPEATKILISCVLFYLCLSSQDIFIFF